AANEEARKASMQAAVQSVNAALRSGDPRQTVSRLMNPDLQLPPVFPSAAALYHRELGLLQRRAAQGELQQEELFVAVEMLSAVALINEAMVKGNRQQFCSSLVSSSAGLSDVDYTLMDRYSVCLCWGLFRDGQRSDLLTWNQLQEGINEVNSSMQEEHQRKNTFIGNCEQLLSALLAPSCGVEEVLPENISRYLMLLRKAQVRPHGLGGASLWLTDIQEEVRRANQQRQKALKLCLAVAAVNQAVKENRANQTLRVLSLPELQLQRLVSDCANDYQRQLSSEVTQRRRAGDNRSPWVRVRLEDDSYFYFHLSKLEGTWDKPSDFIQNNVFVNREDVQEVVSSVWSSHNRSALWRSNEALIVGLQAACRGFLVRQGVEARRRFLIRQTPAVVVPQAHWRRFVQQRAYRQRLQFLYLNWRAVVKIQSMVKMWLARRRYRARLNFFKRNVGAIIKIQAFFRASRARDQYRMLVHADTPPLSVVRKFLHLLDMGDSDIREEAELLKMREEVVRGIRFNRQLESDLDLMDLKIGLLVRNRATLQEVVSHCKKLTKKNKEQLSDMMDIQKNKGLKALSRDKREKLEGYQHLFYLLQTQPLYLAQLLFLLPPSGSASFMETLVFSLFNYGSDRRDAFLLLQLFTAALRYEIRLKVEQPKDVVTGNPVVIKMLVNFYRHAGGDGALRHILAPALQDVLQDSSVSIKTDPVEVYKTWINQSESRTGLKSCLPYDVSAEEALSHPEVQRRVDIAIINLKNMTERVFKAIISNLSKLPYGLRYTAKVLRDALKAKFPRAREDELYKIVGNLVYYRYMNPAVVAPDGFDVLERSAGSALQPDVRHLLGTIARMLQHAAANKHFHGDGGHIRALNEYISQMHGKFRRFLVSVCDVPEPDERFSMDEFSELLNVTRPVIYVSVSELINTHKLLLEHQETLCPDSSDPLRLLLQDLGSVPTLQDLTGETCSSPVDHGPESALTHEISLTLTNKFDIFNDDVDKPDARGLLLRLASCHDWLVQRRTQQDARTPDKLKRNQSLIANGKLSLEEKKRKILRNLRRLEGLGVLRQDESERQILQMLAKDIRQQRLRRQRRGAELVKLRQTLSSLQTKSRFHSEQVDYYRHYITSCLDNLTKNSKSTNKKTAESKGKKKVPALSYSATRLQEKGVLIEIQDLPSTQFKNVVFDIVPGPEKGSFRVKTRFLGVEMEEFLLQYQVRLHQCSLNWALTWVTQNKHSARHGRSYLYL
uniref:IQ motif containing GTPase activating protein 3 n=1 Tax=Cynoglossus semilaevis TaxID=244447 RepID=A0A3P8WZ56_CYNSE